MQPAQGQAVCEQGQAIRNFSPLGEKARYLKSHPPYHCCSLSHLLDLKGFGKVGGQFLL